jgi:phosphoribosylaminoimidazole-succinocarboxamide synthase
MPDHIPHKGEAIAVLGAYFFEKLEGLGIPTHYVGLVEDGKVRRLGELARPSDALEVKILRVVKPALDGDRYDYSMYRKEERGFLIPLEVIYRNALPQGSSVFRRLANGQTTYRELGLSTEPKAGQRLDPPILDVSTKLEITDRYMSWAEAQEIAALSDEEVTGLKELAQRIDDIITDEFGKLGLVNEDGKIEVGFDHQRRLMLVDVLGTLDECRFTYEGIPVSKEIARIHYRNTPWYEAVETAKKKDRQNWKGICELQPDPLPPEFKSLISQVYCACTNRITGREWFADIPPIGDILKGIKGYIS